MGHFHRHLQMAIRVGVYESYIFFIFSALSHFDPPQVAVIRELWPLWMTDILGSRYQVLERCKVAGQVVNLVWEQIKHETSYYGGKSLDAASVPPLLGFLRLGEEIRWEGDGLLTAGVLALRILSCGTGSSNFCSTILPVLASTLRPTHPLQSRKTALRAFCRFGFGWLSSRTESLSSEDCAGLLRAVGDPFQSTPDTILLDKRHAFKDEYHPMNAAAILIKFAASDLWRDHLRRSNFVSCEEVISTSKGREYASAHLHDPPFQPQSFLRTPTKIISAIERLEALQCPNIIEVILMSAWTIRGLDGPSIDFDGWRLVQQRAVSFYQTHGIGRLKALSRNIMADPISYFYSRDPRCRVEGVRLPVRIATEERKWGCMEDWEGDIRLAQVCQRRMLYQLFGCNPTTWEEMLAAGSDEAGEGVDVSVGQSGVPAQFMDWSSDYP